MFNCTESDVEASCLFAGLAINKEEEEGYEGDRKVEVEVEEIEGGDGEK